jgi:hypothetical protein
MSAPFQRFKVRRRERYGYDVEILSFGRLHACGSLDERQSMWPALEEDTRKFIEQAIREALERDRSTGKG